MEQDKLNYGVVRMLDIETYPNLFLICLDNPQQYFFTPQDLLEHLWQNYNINNPCTLVTYNGLGYDFPMLQKAYPYFINPITDQATRTEVLRAIKDESNKLIGEKFGFNEKLGLPAGVRHIDLVGVCPPFTNLKLLGARLNCESVQDLPYHHETVLTQQQAMDVVMYCLHDLEVTRLVFNDRKDALDVRNWDQKNLSDAQMAERALVPNKQRGKKIVPQTINVFGFDFNINPANGSPIDPKFPVQVIDGVSYQVGLGGLHSVDTSSVIDLRGQDEMVSIGIDVASYYPSMICESLKHVLDDEQYDIYSRTKALRLHAKATGDKQLDATLKIVLNGSFGKFGSKYSALYNPTALLSITLLGQIQLLDLIRRFANSGYNIKVLSANTDGIECYLPRSSIEGLREVYRAWENDTKMVMEEEQTLFVARRDVNNYFMLVDSKKKPIKTKGIFEPSSIKKSLAFEIIYEAVMASFGIDRKGEIVPVKIDDYIWQAAYDSTKFTKFLAVRTVNDGAVLNPVYETRDDWVLVSDRYWENSDGSKHTKRVSRPKPYQVFMGGDPVGRVIRWYIGETGQNVYTPKGGKVPLTDNAVLVQDFRCKPDTKIDVMWYINRAEKLRAALLGGEAFDDELGEE